MNKGPNRWFSEFLGVGYTYHDIYMNVLLLFGDNRYAVGLWNETLGGWAEDQVRLKFIEHGDNYWLILFQEGSSLILKEDIGFIKCVPMSDNYVKFKNRYELKAIIRFAIYKRKSKAKEKELPYDVKLLKKIKYVCGVEFLHYDEIPKNSTAFEAINQGL